MFQVSCRITKAADKNGRFIIRGVASSTKIDRDQERFDERAIQKMKEHIKKTPIPLRVEHLDGWHNIVGTVIDADIDAEGQLVVEAEVDKDMSVGRDFIHICKLAVKGKAKMPQFSVAGSVLDAGFEFVKELGRNIKVYKDLIIEEISLVTNPSNYDVTLEVPFAKSVNWKKMDAGICEKSKAGLEVEEYITKMRSQPNSAFASFLHERGQVIDKSEQQYVNWVSLQEFVAKDEYNTEQKLQAVSDFVANLQKSAVDNGYSLDEECIQKAQTAWSTSISSGSSNVSLTPYLLFFTKTMLHNSTNELTLNPEQLENGISFFDAEHAPSYMKSFFARDGVTMIQVEKKDDFENVTPLTSQEWEEIEKACKKPMKTKKDDGSEEDVEQVAEETTEKSENESTESSAESEEAPAAEENAASEDAPTNGDEQQLEKSEEESTDSTDEEPVPAQDQADSSNISDGAEEQATTAKSNAHASRLSNSMRLFVKQCGDRDNSSAVLDSLVDETKGVFESAAAFAALDSRKLTKSSDELTRFSTSLLTALPILNTARKYSEEVEKSEGEVVKSNFSSIVSSFTKEMYSDGMSDEDKMAMEAMMMKDPMWQDGQMNFMMAGMMYFLHMLVCYKVEQYVWDLIQQYEMMEDESEAMEEGESASMDAMKSALESKLTDFYQDEFVKGLPDEAFALILGDGENRVRMLPHHNKDLSVNKFAVLDGMRRLMSENLTPEVGNFKKAFDALIEHLKEFSVAWAAKSTEEEVVEETASEETKEEAAVEKTVDVYAELDKVLKNDSTEESVSTEATEENVVSESEEDSGLTDIEEVAKSANSHKFSKAMDKVVKYMTQVEETLQKSAAENAELNKKYSDLSDTVAKSVELLEKVANSPRGRQSVSNYAALKKSETTDAANMTFEQLLDHNVSKSGDNFADAYKAAKQGMKL